MNTAGQSTGALTNLSVGTGYTVLAELLRSGSVIDTATRNFVTTAPTPTVTFDFGGSGATNFRMTYSGVTSINVAIDLGGVPDVDHARANLDPTQEYSHTASRKRFGISPSILWASLDGLRVTATGPGGTITINYGDLGDDIDTTRDFYRARGWNVLDPLFSATINASRTYGPGVYT